MGHNTQQESPDATYSEEDVLGKLHILSWALIVYSTAIQGPSVEKIMVAAGMVEREWLRRLSTAMLNQVVREAVAFRSPPRTKGGKRGILLYSRAYSTLDNKAL